MHGSDEEVDEEADAGSDEELSDDVDKQDYEEVLIAFVLDYY